MVKKIFYSSSCSTCARIIAELGLRKKGFEFKDIKTEKITAAELDEMKKLAGSYEKLFSRVALKYKTLQPKPSRETDYRRLILGEYTFLRRPVILIGEAIFIGNAKSVIALAREKLMEMKIL
jgi:arsenate reductase